MEKVWKLKEAKSWFDKNEKEVLCIKHKNKQYLANDYESAEKFYHDEIAGEKFVDYEKLQEKLSQNLYQIKNAEYGLTDFSHNRQNWGIPNIANITPELRENIICGIEKRIKLREEENKTILENYPELEPFYILCKIVD